MAGKVIQEDVARVIGVLREGLGIDSYKSIVRLGGLTNHSYHVTLHNDKEYVVRIPGEGTEALIVRRDEKRSTELACRLGVDAPMIYFGEDGSKLANYIPNAITMSAESLSEERHIDQVATILKRLHSSNEDTGITFDVFDMAASYERIISDLCVPMFENYQIKKQEVLDIKMFIDTVLAIKKVPCHNDPLCENWVEGNGRMYLIDWEYAGMNDAMWDVADVSIEAGYDDEKDWLLLTKYLGSQPTSMEMKHFLANKIYVDYLWTLWAKARVPYDGELMENWAAERYTRLVNNIQKFRKCSPVTCCGQL